MLSDATADLGDLHAVRQPVVKDFALRGRYDLRYARQPPEGWRVEDSIAVALARETLIATTVRRLETVIPRMALVSRGDMPR